MNNSYLTALYVILVNGNYTEWGNWSECSKSCGPGKQFRSRNCTNPEPAHGGAECQGPAVEAKDCILELLCEGKEHFDQTDCVNLNSSTEIPEEILMLAFFMRIR